MLFLHLKLCRPWIFWFAHAIIALRWWKISTRFLFGKHNKCLTILDMALRHLNNLWRLFVFLWRVSLSAFLCSWSMSSSNSHLLKAKLQILWSLYDPILGSILIIKFSLDSSKCSSWNSNYYLSNGYWSNEATSTINILSIITNSIIAGTVALAILTNSFNSASFASVWAIINQLQLFLLLILTRVYLPLDIINFIIGSKIAMFPYDYIPFKKLSYSSSINDIFDSDQNDETLAKVGVVSASSFVNNYSLFSSFLSVALLNLCVLVVMLLVNKREIKGKWEKPFKVFKWLVQKVYYILTFGY